jgi:hypothetical protein
MDRSEYVQGLPEYGVDVLNEICDLLAKGVPLKRICEDKLLGPDTPNLSTLHRWRRCDPRITEVIDAAKVAGAETIWEDTEREVVEILDGASGGDKSDVMLAIAKAKLVFDFRKTTVTMMLARIYGDKKVNGTQKNEKSLRTALDQMERDGKIVVVEMVEVPALEAGKDTLQ